VQPAGTEKPLALDQPYVFEDDASRFCAAGVGAKLSRGRTWTAGERHIPQDEVVGRAVAILWPASRIGLLPAGRSAGALVESATACQHADEQRSRRDPGAWGSTPVPPCR
jgi:hypothetical protein